MQAQMPVPRHHLLKTKELITILKNYLHDPGLGNVFLWNHQLHQSGYSRGISEHPLSLVPFFEWVIQGSVCLITPREEKMFHRGEAILFPANSTIPVRYQPNSTVFRITFDHDLSLLGQVVIGDKLLQGDNTGLFYARSFIGPRPVLVDDLLEKALSYKDKDFSRAAMQVSLHEWCRILEAQESHSNKPKQIVNENSKINEILNFIHYHAHEGIDRESTARAFGMSAATLSAHFSRMKKNDAMFPGFQQTLLNEKLQRACHLLQHSNLKLEAIARHSGFDSLNYFSQAFKRSYEQSPSAYRKYIRRE